MNRLKSHNIKLVKRLTVCLDEDAQPDGNTALPTGSKSPRRICRIVNAPQQCANYYRRTESEARVFGAMADLFNKSDEGGVLLITGHSGVGVTTLVAQQLQENGHKLSHEEILVFWLNSSRYHDFEVEDEDKLEALFDSDLIQLAKSVDPAFDSNSDPTLISSYFREKKNCRVLFVFDDMPTSFKLTQKSNPFMSSCMITQSLEAMRTKDEAALKIIEIVEEISNSDLKKMLETVYCMKGKLSDQQLAQLAECCCGHPLIANLISAGFQLGPDTWDFDTFMRSVGKVSKAKVLGDRQFRIVTELFRATFNQLHHQWRKCYYSFLIFNPGEHVPLKDLEIFWTSYSVVSSANITEFFETRALISRSPDSCHLAIHPLLYEAALATASEEYKFDNSQGHLQHLRLRLLTCAAEGEMILFTILRDHKRLDLLKRIIDKVTAENLAQLCKKHSASESEGCNMTFLQYMYKIASSDAQMFKWQGSGGSKKDAFAINPVLSLMREILLKLLRSLTAKEVLNTVNAPSEDGTSSFLMDILDDEMLEQLAERQPLMLLLNRWRLVYINKIWKRFLTDSEMNNQLLLAVLNDEEQESEDNEEEKESAADSVMSLIESASEQDIKEAFVAAARYDRMDMVQRLYNHRTTGETGEISWLDNNDIEAALMFASAAGYLDIVTFLTEKSEKVASMRDSEDRTPFFVASENDHADVVEYFFRKYKNAVELTDKLGRTPLWAAANNGSLEAVRFLCEDCSANIFQQDCDATTPLWIAARNGHFPVVRYLCESKAASTNDTTKQSSPCWVAAANGQMEIVRYLGELDSGQFLSLPNAKGETPMFIAAKNGHLDIVKYIYKKDKCSVSVADKNATTPLSAAANTGRLEIVKFLVDKYYTAVSLINNSGVTPLWAAASSGHLQVVKFLYQCNRSCILRSNDEGMTPLRVASVNGHREVAIFLLEQLGNNNAK